MTCSRVVNLLVQVERQADKIGENSLIIANGWYVNCQRCFDKNIEPVTLGFDKYIPYGDILNLKLISIYPKLKYRSHIYCDQVGRIQLSLSVSWNLVDLFYIQYLFQFSYYKQAGVFGVSKNIFKKIIEGDSI